MTRIARFAAIAITIAATGSAFAESPAAGYADGAAGTSAAAVVSSRVAAPSLKAPRGTTVVTEADLNRTDSIGQAQTRQAVRDATSQALARGEINSSSGELGPFSGAQVVARAR